MPEYGIYKKVFMYLRDLSIPPRKPGESLLPLVCTRELLSPT